MRIFFSQGTNFGDTLNQWLWPRLFESPVESYFDDESLFLGIGTLLGHTPQVGIDLGTVTQRKIVFGSGAGYGSPYSLRSDDRVYCVRGPRTARLLGLPSDKAVTDPAILMSELIDRSSKGSEIGLMLHHVTTPVDDWAGVAAREGLLYIDPLAPTSEVTQKLLACRLVITEAMHGAIVADAFRIPWIPVRTRPGINAFKWADWSESVGIAHRFEWLPAIWSPNLAHAYRFSRGKRVAHRIAAAIAAHRLRSLIKNAEPRLSRSDIADAKRRELWTSFRLLCTDGLAQYDSRRS